jgi:lipopolysaccharide/colanic/teichoic acid biosynthesis glycosyltransferase
MSVSRSGSYDQIKRCSDAVIAGLMLLVSSPVQLVVGSLVALAIGRPVLFRQQRPGRNGQVFTLYKFRTMKNPDAARGLTTDTERLTPFGRALRATSLDELPTLFNVLRGDMSLVGPRPLLVAYLDRYSPHQARRHEVRPGITGLAQVSGRNAISWKARFDLDVQYVDRYSFSLDLSIIRRTVGAVLRRDGITAADSATMPEFTGRENESS